MRFLCLIHHTAAAFERMSPDEHRAMQIDSAAYDEVLLGKGKLVLAEALRSPADARTVKVRERKASVTDGPFAEMKEQIIGFLLIEAEDMEEAVEIAEQVPLARTGVVEVREAYDAHSGLVR